MKKNFFGEMEKIINTFINKFDIIKDEIDNYDLSYNNYLDSLEGFHKLFKGMISIIQPEISDIQIDNIMKIKNNFLNKRVEIINIFINKYSIYRKKIKNCDNQNYIYIYSNLNSLKDSYQESKRIKNIIKLEIDGIKNDKISKDSQKSGDHIDLILNNINDKFQKMENGFLNERINVIHILINKYKSIQDKYDEKEKILYKNEILEIIHIIGTEINELQSEPVVAPINEINTSFLEIKKIFYEGYFNTMIGKQIKEIDELFETCEDKKEIENPKNGAEYVELLNKNFKKEIDKIESKINYLSENLEIFHNSMNEQNYNNYSEKVSKFKKTILEKRIKIINNYIKILNITLNELKEKRGYYFVSNAFSFQDFQKVCNEIQEKINEFSQNSKELVENDILKLQLDFSKARLEMCNKINSDIEKQIKEQNDSKDSSLKALNKIDDKDPYIVFKEMIDKIEGEITQQLENPEFKANNKPEEDLNNQLMEILKARIFMIYNLINFYNLIKENKDEELLKALEKKLEEISDKIEKLFNEIINSQIYKNLRNIVFQIEKNLNHTLENLVNNNNQTKETKGYLGNLKEKNLKIYEEFLKNENYIKYIKVINDFLEKDENKNILKKKRLDHFLEIIVYKNIIDV